VTRIAADFFDGRSARAYSATLQFDPDGCVRVVADGVERSYTLDTIEIRDRVGARAPREILFPDGASVRVPPSIEADAFLDRAGPRPSGGWLRRLEANWRIAAAATAALLLAGALFARYGIPALSAVIAARIPPSLEVRIGDESLDGMDEAWLTPSRVSDARRTALGHRFEAIVRARPLPGIAPRLEFRASRLVGPNAFALPGGAVIVTDEIVALAAGDDELEAVLAHEYGHLASRHGLEQLVQSTLVATAVALLTADASGVVSMAAAAPAVMLQAGYSRDMESEADAFAYAWLDRRGIRRDVLAELLARVEEKTGAGGVPSILSTHPSLQQRADAARNR